MQSSHSLIQRSFLISSASRNAAAFPTPQNYVVPIPAQKAIAGAYLGMANFVSPAAPPLVAALQVAELGGSGLSWTSWQGGGDTTLASIPLPAAGARVLYEPSSPLRIDALPLHDVGYCVNMTTLTLNWVDETGAPLATMPEHVVRIFLLGADVF